MVREIDFKAWKVLAEETQDSSAPEIWPWQNLFSASQFTGFDFVTGPRPRYFGYFLGHELIAALCVLKISETVARIRIPCCRPGYQKKGLASELLQSVIRLFENEVHQWIVFSNARAISYYKRNGFQLEPGISPMAIRSYDPGTGQSQLEPDLLYFMVRKEMEVLQDSTGVKAQG